MSFVDRAAIVVVERDVIWEADRDEISDIGARALCAAPSASEIERAAAFKRGRGLAEDRAALALTKTGAQRSRCNPVHPRAGFRNYPPFTHPSRDHDLAKYIVNLVRARVVKLIALEKSWRPSDARSFALQNRVGLGRPT